MAPEDDWMSESDDELDEEEFPDENDDLTETVPCPACGEEIYEDAEQCPYCGTYVTHQASPWAGRSIWWIVLAGLGLIATILALSGFVP